MNLVFGMDGIICTPCKDYTEVEKARPLTNVREFMLWLKEHDHKITIWCKRPNSLDWVMATKDWLAAKSIYPMIGFCLRNHTQPSNGK